MSRSRFVLILPGLEAPSDAENVASKAAGTNRYGFADSRRPDVAAPGLSFIAWSDTHETGLRALDEQHKELTEMIGRPGSDLAAGEDVRRVRASIEKLIAFAQVHFAAEEALMNRQVIEERVPHAQAHLKLVQDARSLAAGLDESNMMMTMSSLHEWLLRHVDTADKELARQLQAQGYGDAERKTQPLSRAPDAGA